MAGSTARIAAGLALAALLAPSAAPAQVSWASRTRLSLEPSAGLFRDVFAPDRETGWVLGLRLAWGGPRLRLFQAVRWGRTSGLAPADPEAAPGASVRNEWLLATTGVDYPLHRGTVDLFARAGLGFAWVRPVAENGDPRIPVDGFQSRQHVLVGLVLERDVRSVASVRVALTDRLYDLFAHPLHGPGLDVGVVFSFE
jgi:hypothetical protein